VMIKCGARRLRRRCQSPPLRALGAQVLEELPQFDLAGEEPLFSAAVSPVADGLRAAGCTQGAAGS
jgi:hypothetical protein